MGPDLPHSLNNHRVSTEILDSYCKKVPKYLSFYHNKIEFELLLLAKVRVAYFSLVFVCLRSVRSSSSIQLICFCSFSAPFDWAYDSGIHIVITQLYLEYTIHEAEFRIKGSALSLGNWSIKLSGIKIFKWWGIEIKLNGVKVCKHGKISNKYLH